MSDLGALQCLDRAITELLAARAVWVSSPRARELLLSALGDACAAKEALQRVALASPSTDRAWARHRRACATCKGAFSTRKSGESYEAIGRRLCDDGRRLRPQTAARRRRA